MPASAMVTAMSAASQLFNPRGLEVRYIETGNVQYSKYSALKAEGDIAARADQQAGPTASYHHSRY